MSTELFAAHGLYVTRYAGPASLGDDRAMFQFTIPGEYMSVNRAELRYLLAELNAVLQGEVVSATGETAA